MTNPIRMFILCAGLATSVIAFASPQQSPGDAKPLPPETQRLAQRLALTHDQKIQLRTINQDRKTQLNAVQADASLSPHARRQKVKDIHADAEGKIRGMLNQSQLEEYDQIKRERQEQRARQHDTTTPAQPSAPPPQ
jgi:hypothetical protein